MRACRWLVIGLSVVCSSCASIRLPATTPAVVHRTRQADLDVPYLAQSELLCGGAAIAMIERWWGRRGVFAEDFAQLVRPASGGILTTDMSRVMRERGWEARALSATAPAVQASLADSVPVITLIQVSPNRYHYVVIVGWSSTEVTYHDPAVSPSVRLPIRAFEKRWEGANRWALFARPSRVVMASAPAPLTPPPAPTIDSLPCRPWLDKAADAASRNHLNEADQFLGVAVTECASEPLVIRELAGVRFRQGKHAEAMRLAYEYSRRAPADSLGWQLLASSRYLAGDALGALQAWNVIGRPVIDLLRIDGISHIRFRTLADGMGIHAGDVLTPARLALAQRRIADIPALAVTRASYTGVAGGAVEVHAVVVERPLLDRLPLLLAGTAISAVFRREVSLATHSPLGLGEVLTGQWRWQRADPCLALRVDIPARIGVPAIVSVDRSWEGYRFSAGVPDERRSVTSVAVSGWANRNIEALAGTRFEHWSAHGDFFTLSGGGALHTSHDHVTLLAMAEHAIPLSGNASFDRIRTRVAWTLPDDRWSNTWSMRLGADATGAATPRGLWPLAGDGLTREIPLRAHTRIIDDKLSAARTGRRIVHGGIAGDRPIGSLGPLTLGAGIFVDGAHVVSPGDGSSDAQLYVDGGAGVRVGVTGSKWAAVRIDVARGLVADRRWGVSVSLAQVSMPRLTMRPD